ncbi:hypothetical protein [Aphanothece minutissima]|uniref:hypothetical protein n=1 Tax=Aphanothece minutissima TaxID=543815 RepID=UPI0011B26B4C|nr:hypothetical protein [Aphanothece minutissima]
MNLDAIQLQLQDLSCKLNDAAKQDLHIALCLQQTIDSTSQTLDNLLAHASVNSALTLSDIRNTLINQLLDDPERHAEAADMLGALDRLDSHLLELSIMQDMLPSFAYKETIQPLNQV